MDDILDNELTNAEYKNFREFLSIEEANDFGLWLKVNEIDFKIEKPSLLIDKAIVGKAVIPEAIVKINTKDFARVSQLLAEEIEAQDIPEEHYLLAFSDRELFDVLRNPHTWNIEDIVIAKKILIQNGYKITEDQVEQLRKEKYDELRAGKKGNTFTIFFYLMAVIFGVLTIHPLLFIAGIGMGWHYWKDTSTDPNGEIFYTFTPATRNIGKIIFIVGIVMTTITFALLLLSELQIALIRFW